MAVTAAFQSGYPLSQVMGKRLGIHVSEPQDEKRDYRQRENLGIGLVARRGSHDGHRRDGAVDGTCRVRANDDRLGIAVFGFGICRSFSVASRVIVPVTQLPSGVAAGV